MLRGATPEQAGIGLQGKQRICIAATSRQRKAIAPRVSVMKMRIPLKATTKGESHGRWPGVAATSSERRMPIRREPIASLPAGQAELEFGAPAIWIGEVPLPNQASQSPHCASAYIFQTGIQDALRLNTVCGYKTSVLHYSLAAVLFFATAVRSFAASSDDLAIGPGESASARSSPVALTNLSLNEVVARLCEEGTNRSQISNLFCYLTDIIGPRLTGSPNCKRANEWTRDQLCSWGLTNAHLEAWGPFGRGWSLKRFAAQITEPQAIPLIGWPKAWSWGSETSIVAEVVFLDARSEADLEKNKGKLAGKIVLISTPRQVALRPEPLSQRLDDTQLLKLANAAPPVARRPTRETPPARPATTNLSAPASTNELARAQTNAVDSGPPRARRGGPRGTDALSRLRFAVREGAAATVSVSGAGDGGAILVGEATVVSAAEPGTNRFATFVRAWATNAPAGPPQIVLAVEHYNRLVHLAQAGEKPRMELAVQTQFHDDLMSYNTIADLPGTDLKKEIVMLGAHLDSMAGGTGGADNAAGVVICLEAVRLLKTLGLQPRRTIRIGLWTGEEQGLHGSKAYVARHFGYYTNQAPPEPLRSPRDAALTTTDSRNNEPRRTLIRHPDYDRFSAYYNLDNGSGRLRGIYLQGNEPLRAIFRPWLTPLRELGADTLTASNTGSTDHMSFDAVGLPGFQFIQDPLEYWRSYHTTMDVRERGSIEDMQQAAIVMATFIYQTAMLDERLPRKPLAPEPSRRQP
jgi:carboxypeptidase Q